MSPDDLLYTKEHEWIRVDGETGAVGITDHAQKELGEVVYVELPKVGDKVKAGQTFGNVESVKAVSELFTPVSGEVIEINEEIGNAPEMFNEDPYGKGWLIRILLADPSETADLMSNEEYDEYTAPKTSSMRYIPSSHADRQQMLDAIGVDSIDRLFAGIPEKLRLRRMLDIPRALTEPELIEYFRKAAARNVTGDVSFIGAGIYRHHIPIIIDALISRSEFFTAYTPYQAEIAQGTLQAIFEFQTYMTQLTGMEVANASLYDGSTALTKRF